MSKVVSLESRKADRELQGRQAARDVLSALCDDLDQDEARVTAVIGVVVALDDDGEECLYLRSAGRHLTLLGTLSAAHEVLGEQ